MSKNKSIIFVCLGNIYRSPIAEGIARRYAKENGLDILIDSAGTGDWHIGNPPCDDSIKVSQMNNLDISKQRARQVIKEDFEKYDIVIGLDDSNISNLKNLGCKNPLKLGSFGYENADVPDPYFFEEFEGFHEVYKMIDICVQNLLKEKF